MTDQPEQSYPGDFAVTAEGLAVLHQRLGKAVHAEIEASVRVRAEMARAQKLAEGAEALKAHYEENYVPRAAPEAPDDVADSGG